MPASAPFPGIYRIDKTPYIREIVECCSPYSTVRHVVCMKGAQIAFTTAAENVILYYMAESPAPIMYMSATEELLQKWVEKRIEPAIDSIPGLRNKMFSQIDVKNTKRTGDKIFSKQFIGGSLDMVSARSPSGQRSDSIRILIRDEIDGAPRELTTGEGNWLAVSAARIDAYDNRAKIFDFSTPTTFEGSQIWPAYEKGDQRKYLVPCPLCGKFQILELNENGNHGLRAERKGGKLIDAYYLCAFCHDAFFNHHKTGMLAAGRWEPTATSISDEYRSYHMPSYYSPVGMLSWKRIIEKLDEAKKDPAGMRGYVNLVEGMPFKETGYRPSLETVLELRGSYQAGTVPDDVLYLSMGVDVQRGSEKDPNNPPRLEFEIVGHGGGYRSWGIWYGRIEGEVKNHFEGAWAKLDQMALDRKFVFKRKDGREFMPSICFIDSGDGVTMPAVYGFANSWSNTWPSKGFGVLTRRSKEGVDEMTQDNFKRYRAAKMEGGQVIYEISTNYYKRRLYQNLNIPRQPVEPQRPGFCDFPGDYSEDYFRMLQSEEQLSDGSYQSGGRRNEALDARVYANCAGEVYLDNLVLELKAALKASGGHPAQIQEINHRFAIEWLRKQIAPVVRRGK
jgi:phage terminase large subunit GpA-like protein